MVICGSSRRSLENPLSRNPSPSSVSKYRVEHVVEHQARRAQPGVRGARRGDLLPPGVLRERAQPPRDGPVRTRRHAGFLQHPRAVQLADRLDDPRQHQLAEHLVPARGPVEAQHPVGVLQRVQQAAHPRRGDRQRPARRRRHPGPGPARPARPPAAAARPPSAAPAPRRHAPSRGARCPATRAARSTRSAPPSHPTSSSPSAHTGTSAQPTAAPSAQLQQSRTDEPAGQRPAIKIKSKPWPKSGPGEQGGQFMCMCDACDTRAGGTCADRSL